ncbi:MAG: DUF2185 domain-containing protein [Ruminococcus sp.]|nr:DUF2185 domain-containing protein [Ruminococcus sp.]
MDLKALFAQNRKFICETELAAETIHRQYAPGDIKAHAVIGTVDLPTGRIRVGDPLSYLCAERFSPVLERTVKPGSYPVEIAVISTAFDGPRICSSRIKFSDEEAVRYELALPTHETAVFQASDGDAPGFAVDAGMMAFSDEQTAHEYALWLDKWHSAHPDANHYDDYFAELFAGSYEAAPTLQRSGGDFIEWQVPDTGSRIVMNATGFGDGLYQIFWGLDKNGDICELVVPLIEGSDLEAANEEYLSVWDGIEACIVTNHVAEGGGIGYMCRYETEDNSYNGWIFYGFDEDSAYWDDGKNFTLYSTHGLAERFPNIIPLLHSPAGTAYFGEEDGTFTLDDRE